MSDKLGDKVRLQHILECIDYINSFVKGKALSDIEEEHTTRFAIERQLEIIGEAVNRISLETLSQQSQIPWRSVIAMRNILIHEYFITQAPMIWQVVQENIPPLQQAVQNLLTFLEKES